MGSNLQRWLEGASRERPPSPWSLVPGRPTRSPDVFTMTSFGIGTTLNP